MVTAKKKAKRPTQAGSQARPGIQASEVAVGNRTLEGVLIDLAEQVKANDVRSARAEEMAALALNTIAALLQDLRALTQEMQTSNARAEHRLDAIEKAVAAE